ncbi:MAG: PRD domain-containing protein [Olsenella sp.]|jgi:transcriptional regulatory protein LevR/transcriptional regulator with AAA-type ATPase domain|nr:PRD domain-containing protein [Olsenella sp.]
MALSDTKSDLLRYLDRVTRELSPGSFAPFTTMRIASECHVSRNLASQYLNELVREGRVIKVEGRPKLFFHHAAMERFLQCRIAGMEYASLDDLLARGGALEQRDFEKAIGHDLSLSVCVEQLKSAVTYPPQGLPVLLVGDHGTGKELLANLTFEYGVNSGALPKGACFVEVDASRYEESDLGAEADIFGSGSRNGAVKEARGGVVYIHRFDHLSQTAGDRIVARILEDVSVSDGISDVASVRFILGTARPASSPRVLGLSRVLPITVQLPRYSERDENERMVLAMHFLRTEGRRVAADVSISRGALRALVQGDFGENIDGLKSCVATCCANAYIGCSDGKMVIRQYHLPLQLLSGPSSRSDDDQLVSSAKCAPVSPNARILAFFQRLADHFISYESGGITFDEFCHAALETIHDYEDFLNFDGKVTNLRMETYEQVLNPVIEEIDSAYGIELTRKTARVLAQALTLQLWGGIRFSQWRREKRELLVRMSAALSRSSRMATAIVEQMAAKVRSTIGVEIDELTAVVLLVEVKEVIDAGTDVRDFCGVILCHGYATATSIADAVNRILHARVFEAVDMTYDQQMADIVSPLARILGRYSFAREVVILVDMGSLSQVADALPPMAGATIHIISNVSTELALEIGSSLMSHGDMREALERIVGTCTPAIRAIEEVRGEEAILFCSEAGAPAADKLRKLVSDSLPEQLPVRLVTCDYYELERMGGQAPAFSSYSVRAIVGTMDPDVDEVPFIALEDILYAGSSDALDAALRQALGSDGIALFHQKLLRNLTLRNVVESITILNPEMLYLEADRAMQRLSVLSGHTIDARCQIALYVHLCGLIERLVTKNFVETYPDAETFERNYHDFIDWFRQAFDEMCRRYRVEIPVTEIAYVYHMLMTPQEKGGHKNSIANLILEDE